MGLARHLLIALLFCSLAWPGRGQSAEKSALKNIQKKKWPKAEAVLRKSLSKDTLNPTTKYLFALYFFRNDNPSYQLDSAYHYAIRSLSDYRLISEKERARLKRFPLDSIRIISVRQKIDSAAFQMAMAVNTEQSYIEFLEKHPLDVVHRPQAIELRNEVAYQDAFRQNTYQAMQKFLNKYPESVRAPEARQHYDRLLYEALTVDKRLSTFETFLADHPETPFRVEIEQNIFELATLSGSAESFLKYILRYPGTTHTTKARNLLFHLLNEQNFPEWPHGLLNDSLRNAVKLQEGYLLPFLKNGKFGFMNSKGVQIIQPQFEEIPDDYKCEYFTEDYVVLKNKIISRDSKTIFAGEFDEAEDIGSGFLKLKVNGCYSVVHKSGYVFNPCAADARILDNRFIAVKDSTWSLYSFSGRRLLKQTYDDVGMLGKVFMLKRDEWIYLTSLEKIISASEEQVPLLALDSANEVKFITSRWIWTKTGNEERILAQQFFDLVPQSNHTITMTSFGALAKSSEGYTLYSEFGKQASALENVIDRKPWLAVQKNTRWQLLNPKTFDAESSLYDSIQFAGPMFLGLQNDTVFIHFSNKKIIRITQPARTTFLPGKDSTAFLIIEKDNKKTLYSNAGKLLFTFNFEEINHAGKNLFIVTRNQKKGLINAEGKTLLPAEYDAIGSMNGNVVSVLKNLKFGLYNTIAKKLLKPQYEKNIVLLSPSLLLASKDGRFGFIGWDGKPTGKFEFDEIQFWNDSSVWLRSAKWNLIDVKSKKVIQSEVDEIRFIKDTPEEKIVVFKTGNSYGVLSNRRGVVIPATFSDLVNLGPPDDPIYFTEKHVEEAAIFVVIYYNENGKLIKREVYEDADEYERIYCSDN